MPFIPYPPSQPNDVASFVPGLPTASLVMLSLLPARAFSLPLNLTGSRGDALVAAAAATVFSIKKNGVQVGTMNFALGATTATFSLSPAVSFTTSDKLTVTAPLVPDVALSDVSFTLSGTRI